MAADKDSFNLQLAFPGAPSRFYAASRALLRVFLYLCLYTVPAPLHAGPDNDLLMNSEIKSDKWKMDRTGRRDLEIYDGNVSFRNAVYNLKADNAVYDRAARAWTIRGSVYCLRKFRDGSYLELNCDNGKYFEESGKAEVFRGTAPVRMNYLSADGKPLKGLCDHIVADNAKASMDFLGNFYMRTQQMEIFSDNGFYTDADHSFLIYNSVPDPGHAKTAPRSAPVAVGNQNGRDFAMTGEKMKFFKDTGDVKLYNNVAGWVKAVDEPKATIVKAQKGPQ